MKFEISFNTERDDSIILDLGARWEDYEETSLMVIDLETFEELENLLDKIDILKEDFYSAIISFDPPTIFLDKDV